MLNEPMLTSLFRPGEGPTSNSLRLQTFWVLLAVDFSKPRIRNDPESRVDGEEYIPEGCSRECLANK